MMNVFQIVLSATIKRRVISWSAILALGVWVAGAKETNQTVVARPEIVTREQWGSKPEPLPDTRKHTPKFITIHHAGVTWKAGGDPFKFIRNMQTWGQSEKHWPDLPYHFLIAPDGRIFEGRPLQYEPESNTKYDLQGHIGIELMGNFEEQRVAKAQLASCARLAAWLCQELHISPEQIAGHQDRAKGQTDCPGRDFYRYIRDGQMQGWVKEFMRREKPEIELLPPLPAGPTNMIESAGNLSGEEVIRKAVARGQRKEPPADQPVYTYTRATITEELDSSGKVKERKEKVYRVVLQGGKCRQKALELNGHPLAEEEIARIAENDATARQLLADPKSKKAGRDDLLTPEIIERYDFTLTGRETINGREAYLVAFQPKSPEVPTHRLLDRLLNQVTGTLWIDAEEFEVARADAQLKSEVKILGGALAALKKIVFTMTRTRVAEGVWISTSSSGEFQGRKLIEQMRVKTRSQSSNFRRVG